METIILCGIQGAGKSTFCRDRYWDSHIRINYDMLRTRHREKLLVAACIEAKQSFVVDATNPTTDDRKRYIAIAKEARFKIVGIEFQIATGLAIARNTARSGKGQVPEKAIYATAAKLQSLSFGEGFDEIWQAIVTLDGVEIKEKQREI